MPPFLDSMQLSRALRREALPALERFAENDRALRRFDQDEPPPYVSSTEDEEDEMPYPTLAASDELHHLVDPPLNDEELDRAAVSLHRESRVYDPGKRYAVEELIESDRIHMWTKFKSDPDVRDYFVQLGLASKGRAGRERTNIITRHNIKRRWEKLKVWNPEWGIPGKTSNVQPNDDTSTWKWPWQHSNADHCAPTGLKTLALDPQDPITRAVRLRQGLRRSEHVPALPRPSLPDDASTAQAESFIISRPWFQYEVEISEEVERCSRLSVKQYLRFGSSSKNVLERWKENNEWKADWSKSTGHTMIGWRWQHESPSPEPEDLTGLNDLATFELTPSETDALEAIRPPSPTPERIYIPRRRTRYGPLTFEEDLWGCGLSSSPLRAPFSPVEAAMVANQPSLPQQAQRRSRRLQRDTKSDQPPRRSARIAAMAAKQQQQTLHATKPAPKRPPTAKKSKQGRSRKASELAGVSKSTRVRETRRRKG